MRRLSASAVKLLLDVARQFNGRNNGDLCAALTILRPFGWKSSDTLHWAIKELCHYGLLVKTRQGGLHATSLFALSWLPIDECGGKLDYSPTMGVAPGDWRAPRVRFERPKRKKPVRNPE